MDVSNGIHYQIPEEGENLQALKQVTGSNMKITTALDGFDHGSSVRRRKAEDGRKTPTQQAVEEDGRATPTQLTFEVNNSNNVASSKTRTSANPLEAALFENKAAGISINPGPEVAEVGERNAESLSGTDPGSPPELVSDNSDSSSDQHGDPGYEDEYALADEGEFYRCKGCGQVRKPKTSFHNIKVCNAYSNLITGF